MEGPHPTTGTQPHTVEGGSDRDNKPVTFMSYNMTGADTVKCQWVREISSEHETSFIALQEHFKTIKSTEQWFKKQFSDYHGYVIPAHRRPGVDSGGVLVALFSCPSKARQLTDLDWCRSPLGYRHSSLHFLPAEFFGLMSICHVTHNWNTLTIQNWLKHYLKLKD